MENSNKMPRIKDLRSYKFEFKSLDYKTVENIVSRISNGLVGNNWETAGLISELFTYTNPKTDTDKYLTIDSYVSLSDLNDTDNRTKFIKELFNFLGKNLFISNKWLNDQCDANYIDEHVSVKHLRYAYDENTPGFIETSLSLEEKEDISEFFNQRFPRFTNQLSETCTRKCFQVSGCVFNITGIQHLSTAERIQVNVWTNSEKRAENTFGMAIEVILNRAETENDETIADNDYLDRIKAAITGWSDDEVKEYTYSGSKIQFFYYCIN